MIAPHSENQDILKSVLSICDIHVERIESAFNQVKDIFPITQEILIKNDNDILLNIEMLSSQFSKLQDLMGAKLFSMIIDVSGESSHIPMPTMIDKINQLEKMGMDINYPIWAKLREIRNHLSHEYPDNPDIMVFNLNEFYEFIPKLLKIYENLKSFSLNLLKKLS